MSLIPPSDGSHRWETIRYASDDSARTFRLCVILLAERAARAVPFLIMALVWIRFG
jgi:hypothetical protein